MGGGDPAGGGSRPARRVAFHGATSAKFRSEIGAAVASLPEEIWVPVAAAGVEVRGSRLVSDGGILGYDGHDGEYRPGRTGTPGKLAVAEYKQTPGGGGSTRNPTATLYHEFGHPVYDLVLTARERIDFGKVACGEAWQVPVAHHGRYGTSGHPAPTSPARSSPSPLPRRWAGIHPTSGTFACISPSPSSW